jgi:hypothetical protein
LLFADLLLQDDSAQMTNITMAAFLIIDKTNVKKKTIQVLTIAVNFHKYTIKS